jgi:hypothetical protein
MMEAVRTSETSVNFNVTTGRYFPEDSKLHTRRHENLKSHMYKYASNAVCEDNAAIKCITLQHEKDSFL